MTAFHETLNYINNSNKIMIIIIKNYNINNNNRPRISSNENGWFRPHSQGNNNAKGSGSWDGDAVTGGRSDIYVAETNVCCC